MPDAQADLTFDLDGCIERWRQRLLSSGVISDASVDELEDHLRHELSGLLGQGLSAQEAFQVAAMRCGRPDELSAEYAGDNQAGVWSRRVGWMVGGYLACMVFAGTVNWIAGLAAWVGVSSGLNTAVIVPAMFVVASLCVGTAVFAIAWAGGSMPERTLGRWRVPSWARRSGWGLAMLGVVLIPWVIIANNMFQGLVVFPTVSSAEMGRIAIALSTFNLVLPAVGPLTLLILWRWLSRRAGSAS
ncbi:MAG: hypothetical protein AAGB29_14215 [Planctomycetota bacterium]